MKKVSEDQRMQRVLRGFYRINNILKDVVGTGRRDYVKKLSEHKNRVVDAIHRSKKTIGIGRAIKLFGINRST
jgi:hypothetical protein